MRDILNLLDSVLTEAPTLAANELNKNKDYLITERATFNLSKKESLMLLYILEEVNLLKFENNTQISTYC